MQVNLIVLNISRQWSGVRPGRCRAGRRMAPLGDGRAGTRPDGVMVTIWVLEPLGQVVERAVRYVGQDLPFGDRPADRAPLTWQELAAVRKVHTACVRRMPAGPAREFCSFVTEISARWYAFELALRCGKPAPPERGQLPDVGDEGAREREHRIAEDREHQRPHAAEPIGNRPPDHRERSRAPRDFDMEADAASRALNLEGSRRSSIQAYWCRARAAWRRWWPTPCAG